MNNKQLEVLRKCAGYKIGAKTFYGQVGIQFPRLINAMDIWAKEFLKWYIKTDGRSMFSTLKAEPIYIMGEFVESSDDSVINELYQQFLNETT